MAAIRARCRVAPARFFYVVNRQGSYLANVSERPIQWNRRRGLAFPSEAAAWEIADRLFGRIAGRTLLGLRVIRA